MLLKYTIKFINIMSIVNVTPFLFKYESDTKFHVEIIKNKWRKFCWACNAWGHSLHCIFYVVGFYYYVGEYMDKNDMLAGLFHCLYATGWFVATCNSIHCFFFKYTIADTINKIIGVYNITEDIDGIMKQRWNLIDRLSQLLQLSCIVEPCMHIYMYWARPHYKHFFLAYLPLEWQSSFYVKAIVGILELYWHVAAFSLYLVEIPFNLLYIVTGSTALVLLQRKIRETDGNDLETVTKYQQLRLLNKIYFNGFGKFYLPGFLLCLVTMVLLTASSSIHLLSKDEIEPVIMLVLTIGWICTGSISTLLLLVAGKIHQNSEATVSEFKSVGNKSKLARYIVACPTFGIDLGTFYSITSTSTLEYLNFVLSSLNSILITWNEY